MLCERTGVDRVNIRDATLAHTHLMVTSLRQMSARSSATGAPTLGHELHTLAVELETALTTPPTTEVDTDALF